MATESSKCICKSCGNAIPAGSVFCMYCGEKLVKSKREKKTEIKIPKAKQLPSGSWTIYLAKEKASVTEATEALCIAKAKAIRAGFMEKETSYPRRTLKSLCEEYVKTRENVLDHSTLRGYDLIINNRFQKYMPMTVSTIDWQRMINDEAASNLSGKTIKNSWGLISSTLRHFNIPVPNITLPQIIHEDLPWLDAEQLPKFLEAVKGRKCELGALLALHSLRRSEFLAVTPNDIVYNPKKDQYEIHVEGAIVIGRDNKAVAKETNKNSKSRRIVPIMIPRLQELVLAYDGDRDKPFLQEHPNKMRDKINTVCKSAGLPLVGCHGLRRSFASLCWALGIDELSAQSLGGWNDYKTMHDCYIKLSNSKRDEAVKTISEFYKEASKPKDNA